MKCKIVCVYYFHSFLTNRLIHWLPLTQDVTDSITKKTYILKNYPKIINDGQKSCLSFDSRYQQYLDMGKLYDICGELTINFHIKPAQKQNNYASVFSNFDGYAGMCFNYCYYSSGYFKFCYEDDNHECSYLILKLKYNTWQCVTIVIGHESSAAYLDGVLHYSVCFTMAKGVGRSSRPMILGKTQGWPTFFSGLLSDFQVYKGAFTKEEIQEIVKYGPFYDDEQVLELKLVVEEVGMQVQQLKEQIELCRAERAKMEQECWDIVQFLATQCGEFN